MVLQHDFPPVALSTITERASARLSSLIELQPFSDRPAPQEWRRLYHKAADADVRLNWMPASFVRCKPEERDAAVAGLRAACESANRAYQALLLDAPSSDAMDDRLTIERIAAASTDDEAFPIFWP